MEKQNLSVQPRTILETLRSKVDSTENQTSYVQKRANKYYFKCK